MQIKTICTFWLLFGIVIVFAMPCDGQTSKSFQLKKWSISNGGGINQSDKFQMQESTLGGISIGLCSSHNFYLNGGMMITSVKDTSFAKQPVLSLFQLLQNYPNPFNPTTTIQYQLPKAADVKIQIFNSMGQLVRNLEQSCQQPGNYQVIWDGRNDLGQLVPSGLYYYQIISGGHKKVRKMTLLK